MNLIIKSATIIDSESPHHLSTKDILIENGIITKIADAIKNNKKFTEIQLANLHVSQGWFDYSVSFGEPGFEERETIEQGLDVAAFSGFTTIGLNSNTNPVPDTKSGIAFAKDKAALHGVNLLPIGALTQQSRGENLSEMFDMQNAGAVAFYDYKKPILNANLLKIALQYVSNFKGQVFSFPLDATIANRGVVNENITSTSLGLKGIPNIAEEIQLSRDLQILEYTNGQLHIPTISTAASVELIRKAKSKNLKVSCSVAVHNLVFTDKHIDSFDSQFKVLPPLRTQTDIDALIEGLNDGTIDTVTSDHCPINIELKKLEFEDADFGTIGLESSFGALQTIFSLEKTIDLLTSSYAIFNLKTHPIREGNPARLTFFNPDVTYNFNIEDIKSSSKNAIFLNTNLKGKPYGIYANSNLIVRE